MSKKLLALILSAALCGTLLVSCTTGNGGEDTTDDTSADIVDTTDDTDAPAADVTIEQIHNAIKEAYGENYLPNMPLDPESFDLMFGVKPEWVEEMVAETPMIGFNVDTLIIVKPTEGNEENVLNTLTAYADMQKDGAVQYPMNLPKLQAIQCYAKGGYVFYYVLGVVSDDLLFGEGEYANYTEEELEQAKVDAFAAENQKATDVINSLLGE